MSIYPVLAFDEFTIYITAKIANTFYFTPQKAEITYIT